MVTLTLQIADPKESDLAALSEIIRRLNLSRDEVKVAETPQSSKPSLLPEVSSEKRRNHRELMALFEEFARKDWIIPRAEISNLNKRLFSNQRKASVLYAKRSGYFTLEPKSQAFVGTEKAKEKLKRLREVTRAEIQRSELYRRRYSEHPTMKTVDIDFSNKAFLKNRLVKAASQNESYFSDLSYEEIDRLTGSMTAEEQYEALSWFEAVLVFVLDSCANLNDFFGVMDHFREYLGMAASDFKILAEFEDDRNLPSKD